MSKFSLLLLISFLSIAVFGFTGMEYSEMHGKTGCLAATIEQNTCPSTTGSWGYTFFHIEAFKNFSNAIVDTNFTFLLLLFLGVIFVLHLYQFLRKLLHLCTSASPPRYLFFTFLLFQRQLLRWLILHEKRDPAIR